MTAGQLAAGGRGLGAGRPRSGGGPGRGGRSRPDGRRTSTPRRSPRRWPRARSTSTPARATRLWRKGETSGNVLRLVDIAVDCDGDALLLQVDPTGPTCHRNTRSCFDPAEARRRGLRRAPAARQGFEWLETLWATIDRARRRRSRRRPTPPAFWRRASTAPARKVTEEATEVLMAAKDDAVGLSRTARRRPATPWPARWRTCSTTPWSSCASATCRRPRSSPGFGSATSRRPAPTRSSSSAGRSGRSSCPPGGRGSAHRSAAGTASSGALTRSSLIESPPWAMARRASPFEA